MSKAKRSVLESARLARQCFEAPCKVNHSGKAEGFSPARAYLTEAGLSPEFINAVFDENDSWRDFCSAAIDVYKISPLELEQYLIHCFEVIYRLANGSLDKPFADGFNRHDRLHIDKVMTGGHQILSWYDRFVLSKKFSPEEEAQHKTEHDRILRQFIASGRGHDLGNILSRGLHAWVSPQILFRVVEQFTEDKKEARRIRRAIQLHNDTAQPLIDSWKLDSLPEVLAKMHTDFGPAALTLILADKIDIGPHRVSYKANDKEAINRDPHLTYNLLARNEGLSFDEAGHHMQWRLSFDPGLSKEEELQYLKTFVKPSSSDGKERFMVPESFHKAHREHHIPHRHSWEALFWQVCHERVRLAILSAFALFPHMETFTLVVSDTEAHSESKLVFSRDSLEQDFARTKKSFALDSELR